MEPDADKKLEIIHSMKGQWNLGILFFALGSLVAAAGLLVFVLVLKEIQGSKLLPLIGVGLMGIGAILWSWSVTERFLDPEGFARGTNTPYLFLIYSVLTQAGLVILGLLMISNFTPNWTGWMFLVGGGALFILMVIFRDMPPFAYYVLTLVFSVWLFFK